MATHSDEQCLSTGTTGRVEHTHLMKQFGAGIHQVLVINDDMPSIIPGKFMMIKQSIAGA